MKNLWKITAVVVLFLLVVSAPTPVLAQGGDPPKIPVQNLTMFTTYAAQEVALGENVTFPLTFRARISPQTVCLMTQDLPEGWTASFKGSGRIWATWYSSGEKFALE